MLSLQLSIYLSIFQSIYLSIYLSIHPSIHLSIYLSIYLSILFSRVPRKVFLLSKNTSINVNYSHYILVFTFQLVYIHHDCQETKSKTCNQINRNSSAERFETQSLNTILCSGKKSY